MTTKVAAAQTVLASGHSSSCGAAVDPGGPSGVALYPRPESPRHGQLGARPGQRARARALLASRLPATQWMEPSGTTISEAERRESISDDHNVGDFVHERDRDTLDRAG